MPAHYLFVTGKLATSALSAQLAELAPRVGFTYEIATLNISVAALMTPAWVARHLEVRDGVSAIVVPGSCRGEWREVAERFRVPVEIGPADLRDLPEHFGRAPTPQYGDYNLEIVAEINHAPHLALADLLAQAEAYRASGADVIDLGCDPGHTWTNVGDAVKALRDRGHRVSIDSFNAEEVQRAIRAGAELVLSVNQSNVDAAVDWGAEVVVVPDQPGSLAGLDATLAKLGGQGIPFRLDPILEPVGFGFGASLLRYAEARRLYPQCAMLMGVGNLTELTEVDSAAVNFLLAALCQEWSIGSVLTTAVANWCFDAVRELDIARRLAHYAVTQRVLPKKVDGRLRSLRDRKLRVMGQPALDALAARIKDPNYRLFAERGELHVMNNAGYVRGANPYQVFQMLSERAALDPGHAFYLGFEMAKALTALHLRKNYVQDQALDWGYLTQPDPTGSWTHDGGHEQDQAS